MTPFSLRSLLLAAIVLSNCISWTTSRHHYTHNVSGHRSRHRRQGAGLFLSGSYVLPGGEGTGWGEWGEQSPCSRTCGGGVASQKRICLQIGPDGVPQCTGGDTKYFTCYTQDCPAGSRDFREQQCSEFDNEVFRDVKYRWVPYKQAPNPCELNCMPHGERFYYRHRQKVVDGTRCNDESFDVCVNGTCQPVGCDMMLGSSAREDKCRECRGSGTNCQTTVGVLDTDENRKGYNDMLLIPEGATNIVIAERAPSRNYLALRASNGTYYLNGDYQIDFPRSLVIGGALWYYERNQQGFAAPDKLRCLGPTNEPLILALLLQDDNVGVEYEYSVPNERAPPKNKQYNWVHEEFSPCSAPCGGGYQTRNVTCRSREELELVNEALCDKDLKPSTNETCNTDACEAQWTPGPWGECSKRCGIGGTRSRVVHCTQIIRNGYSSIVGEKTCFDIHGPKPELHQTCNENATCPIWFTGPWKPCNKLCDEGKQKRQVVCYAKNGSRKEILSDKECDDEKPPTEQSCMLQPCAGVDWVLSQWRGCDSCLSTVRTRTAICMTKAFKVVNDSYCAYHAPPVTEELCDKEKLPPCDVQWYATQWSKCSVDCGKGVQTRKIFCGLFDGSSVSKVEDSRCAGQPKYNDSKDCEVPQDKCPSKWFATPWGACSVKCGGGMQYRDAKCLRGGQPASGCSTDVKLYEEQSCNTGPCDEDELIGKTSPSLYDDYEECIEDEEEFPEVGLDSDGKSTVDGFTMLTTMMSDSPTEGSGMWTGSTAEHESTFDTSSTLEESSGSGDDTTDTIFTDDSSTITDDATTGPTTSTISESSGTGTGSTDTEKTGSTVTDSTISTITESSGTGTGSTDTDETGSTGTGSTNTSGSEDTSATSNDTASTVTGETVASGSTEYEETEESGSTEAGSAPTTVSGETKGTETTGSEGSTLSSVSGSTVTSESGPSTMPGTGPTELSSSTETEGTTKSDSSSETGKTSGSESTMTTESGATEGTSIAPTTGNDTAETVTTTAEETVTTETSETSSTDTTETGSTGTTETGSTDTETSSTDTTETGSTDTETSSTDTTETGSTDAETSSTDTTETGSTDTETSSTDTTETGSTDAETSSTTTSETSKTGSTESTLTTEMDITGTTEISSSSDTETTETGSTESTETTEAGSTISTETTEASSTVSSETTKDGSTVSSETTESVSTVSSETTEAGSTVSSETTEAGSTKSTETSDASSTESTETTESGSTVSTETTEAGSTKSTETTESGSTLSTETTEAGSTESTETTEAGSTASTETTKAGSTESTETTDTTETETTEATGTSETGSTETTESYTGSTESTVTGESASTETTEEGSTLSSEGTESLSESSTTESSSGTTGWESSSTLEVFITKKPRVCKPRSCVRSEFGCCPDKKTPALGPFDEGCVKLETCLESLPYRCCPDGVSPAKGPLNQGCPVEPCAETLFGCCNSDNKTAAEGNDQEGCPPPPPACIASKYGCCNDETEAQGPEKEGCPETSTTVLSTTVSTTVTSITVTGEGTETVEESTAWSGSTDAVEGCSGSEYGCCFDNETTATGPEMQGCPCNSSLFGCCPDGVASAQGYDLEGCEKSCNMSEFGCCPDGKTPAHGLDHEGCCLLQPYGCCPDNYKPADGPHLEGCGCQYSHFGCCPDNVTVVTGPSNKGCGCQYSEHGCCPDRHSEASGPEFEGCMCHTYQFGCCPDGVTVAQGPNGQGCYCQQSQFGCCGDEQTHAKGLNRQGCNCATSKHGCCLDGVTEATGPKFQGCTDKPIDRQAACSLKFERGPCHNYSVSWFYDTEYGGCSRFWYGGCEGNGNRFSSKEECEATCVSPPPKEACRLPQIKGACLGYNERWYYDAEREMCSNFLYGGCLGNTNNFLSRQLCQEQCEPERAIDQCNLMIERGSCAGEYLRWGFNKDTRNCEQFVWGGCEGNSNRFSTEAACRLRCNPPGEPQPECSKAQDVGKCNDTLARWSFSQTENRCVPFYYTGCGEENGNNYPSREDCQQACPSAFEPELCTLPASTGDCYEYRSKWYFDTKSQRCEMFYYGGCGGNENRFDSEQECVNRCNSPSTSPAPKAPTAAPQPAPGSEFCFMEIDVGPCNQVETKWGYDSARGQCVSFQFGGCGGNQNNFPSEDHCTYYCKPTQDICQLPMLSGPCDESVMRWFYDAASDSCSQFTYGGCEGNDNRFGTREECENRCKSGPAPSVSTTTTTTTTAKIEESYPSECDSSLGLEQCSRDTVGEVWYYDTETSACKAHENLESGVECRTTGIFYSQEACERSCGVFRNIDVCQYAMEPGPCHNYRPKYYYNKNTSRCEEFAYGGCFGGANRFSTEQECEQVCMTTVDPCSLPAEPGNCVGHMVMWYFHQGNDQCYQFVYGGCGGNDNKFESREVCEGRCRKQPPVTTTTPAPNQTTGQPQPEPTECRTPESLAPCGSNETVFYFDEAMGRCQAANIGGCGSSINLYRSEEECERRCGAFRGIDVCRAGLDPGPCRAAFPKFYFDAASGSCRDFTYGGCQGGANRFSTIEECEEVCASAGPAPECLLPVKTGDQCAELPERRWHYDVTRASCLVFSYQGCGGNENNFRSYEECSDHCRVAQFESPSACASYTEECTALENTCVYGLKIGMTAEGCSRCECEEPPNCDAQQRECDALRCRYGMQRTTSADGCEECKCSDDPCSKTICASTERCEVVPSRDPVTQEALYTAHCESNEITDCDAFTSECSRLQCPYGVQRTRVGRCERCSCVREETNCTLLHQECERLMCHYGLNQTMGDDGCERCMCLPPPCQNKRCPEGERCVSAPFRDPVTRETRYSANCKTVNKPGVCPAAGEPMADRTEGACRQECQDDAECRGVMKCCAHGCSRLCLAPEPPTSPSPSTTHAPDVPRAPEAYTDTDRNRPQVDATEGSKATLRCYFHGNPPPKITWRFGEVTIDSDAGRYRLLSDGALEIISLFRNDSGVYICVAQNEFGTAQQQVTLTVADPVATPAAIADAMGPVTGELGRPLVVRCQAYGYPPPTIYWYRGHGGEMVPYSNALYEARGQDLQIRLLTVDTIGEYECQAYNGEGSAATLRVVVQAYRPPGDTRRNPYLVEREVVVTPRPSAPNRPMPLTTTEEPFFPPYTVPVQTSLPATSSVSAGAQLSLPCEVDGYPEPEVRWTKDEAPLASSDRIWIAGSRLTIERAEVSDSGVYSCLAANAYSSHSSAVRVSVQEVSIPPSCVDNPTFANCALIVQSRFCIHKYYSKFCCKSCVEAGQLDARDALMQADQSFDRK